VVPLSPSHPSRRSKKAPKRPVPLATAPVEFIFPDLRIGERHKLIRGQDQIAARHPDHLAFLEGLAVTSAATMDAGRILVAAVVDPEIVGLYVPHQGNVYDEGEGDDEQESQN